MEPLMSIPPVGWALFAVSFVLAIVVDVALVRLLLDFVQPTSAYVFWMGRVGKVMGMAAWVLYVNLFWYPQFLGAGRPVPQLISALEWGVVAVVAMVAIATYPRLPRLTVQGRVEE